MTGVVHAAARQRLVRAILGGSIIAAGLLASAIFTLGAGTVTLSAGDVLAALTGSADAGTQFVVRELRLPRLLLAIVVGAMFGMSGALFQSLVRNPLGSPDIVGFTQGASLAAVFALLVVGSGSQLVLAGSAIAGGLLAAAVVLRLGSADGALHPTRLVLVGIGVGAMLSSITTWLIATGELGQARGAALWLTGTLNGRGWPQLAPALVLLVILTPIALAQTRRLNVLALGDDAAVGLGLRLLASRRMIIACAVALAAVATASAGPIPFVALAAAPIARRVLGSAGPAVGGAALTGALIVVVSDAVAQRISEAGPLPVGVVTGAAGGCFLAWLLLTEWRSER